MRLYRDNCLVQTINHARSNLANTNPSVQATESVTSSTARWSIVLLAFQKVAPCSVKLRIPYYFYELKTAKEPALSIV